MLIWMDKTDDGSDSQRAEASVFCVVGRRRDFRAERGGGKAKRIIFVRLRPAREGAAAGRNGKTEKTHGYCGNNHTKPATGAQHDDAVREDGADDAGGPADGASDIAGAGRDGLRRV